MPAFVNLPQKIYIIISSHVFLVGLPSNVSVRFLLSFPPRTQHARTRIHAQLKTTSHVAARQPTLSHQAIFPQYIKEIRNK